ncbi:MAG: C10 family peptidase [Muribaculaceae bacterium]|nr:C10 family peptidase [Muribaculaceae bacterium]
MNQFKFIIMLIMALLATACTSDENPEIVNLEKPSLGLVQDMSQSRAVRIGDRFMSGLKKSRSGDYSNPEIQYVFKSDKSRSTDILPDTLAYILNYPMDKGFVVVSGVESDNPILAFSDEGSFSFENESAKENFIDKIQDYSSIIIDDKPIRKDTMSISEGLWADDGCVRVGPKLKITLYYYDPWDKFVKIDNPGCPVGCVAIATGLIMSHCKATANLRGVVYPFPSIVEAIYHKQRPDGGILRTHSMFPSKTYEEAEDDMAMLLYDIGKEVGMKYTSGKSSAYTYKAIDLMKSMGYEVGSNHIYKKTMEELMDFIRDNYLVYVEGHDEDGHAWVIDGGYYKLDLDTDEYLDYYFHCDWGWGGYCNGYFKGEVFALDNSSNYSPINYYPVKAKITY